MREHGERLLNVCPEALADDLGVVVRAAGRGAAREEARAHDGLGAVEREHEAGRAYGRLEGQRLVKRAGEAVDEEARAAGRRAHGLLQQRERHGDGD